MKFAFCMNCLCDKGRSLALYGPNRHISSKCGTGFNRKNMFFKGQGAIRADVSHHSDYYTKLIDHIRNTNAFPLLVLMITFEFFPIVA
jgi:hypothetical protein